MNHAGSRGRLAVLGATLALTLPVGLGAAPVADAANFPAKVDRAFMKSCVKAAKNNGVSSSRARRGCKKGLRCLERRLTLGQFVDMSQAIARGDKTPPHGKTLRRCQAVAGS